MSIFPNRDEIPERNLHPTFRNKPTPEMQYISRSSQINTNGRSSIACQPYIDPETIQAVPTTWDTYYDPNHPDADWSGLVNKSMPKRHDLNHPAFREGIERTEYGIISKEERQEFARKKVPSEQSAGSRNKTTMVIGGIDEPEERWKSSYTRFDNHEGTYRDQLTLEKRKIPMKRIENPGQSRSLRDYTNSIPYPNATNEIPKAREPTYSSRSSFLKGLGEKIVVSNAIAFPENSTPRDVNNKNKGEVGKLLLTENHKAFPGYTGGRKAF